MVNHNKNMAGSRKNNSSKSDYRNINSELFDFLDGSPNAFFAVSNMCSEYEKAGFERLYEGQKWQLKPGRDYYVTRNDSAIIAFRIPAKEYRGFHIMASHSDSPAFKIKPNAEICIENHYIKLNAEKYGSAIFSTWMDRPLSVAGRIAVRSSAGNNDSQKKKNNQNNAEAAEFCGIKTKLINIDRDLMVIPNIPIHFNRDVNEGKSFNAQVDMLPLFCVKGEEEEQFLKLIAEEAGVNPEDILDTDLFLYNRQKACFLGADNEFIGSGRIDDLQCAFAAMTGFTDAKPKDYVALTCVFDNEEVGSGTRQGAASTFLKDTLSRINFCLGRNKEDYLVSLANSFMISADNAHSVHPNHPELCDPTNRPLINNGIVIKYNANQKYTSDAVSAATMKMLCEKAQVPFQTFVNRSDIAGGSTLGNISQTQVAVSTVDIGLAQLAMHSAFETAGAKDTGYLAKLARIFFSC